jgi:hypothetical protein
MFRFSSYLSFRCGRVTAYAEISEDTPQGLKPSSPGALCGTTLVVPFHTEIGKLRREEFVYLFSVIPKFLKVASDAVFVGRLRHATPPNHAAEHTTWHPIVGDAKHPEKIL